MPSNNHTLSILFVPACTRLAPSTRYRVYQYLPYLKKLNIAYKIYPINGEWITQNMIKSTHFGILRKLIYYTHLTLEKIVRFFGVLYFASQYKVIFFQRTTFPFFLEKLIWLVNKNIIFDIDDAIFLPDNKNEKLFYRLKKLVKASETPAILKISKWSIVENKYIESYVKKYCKNVIQIIGPIDTHKIPINTKESSTQNLPVTIGWIGSPSTAAYLKVLSPVFKLLHQKYEIRLKLIGAGDDRHPLSDIEVISEPWKEETELFHLQSFDIGVMPMSDDEWSRGKLGIKMLQYMASGIVPVVSHTPTNEEVIQNGTNGFLVKTQQEWVDTLSLLIENPKLRIELGLNGRRSVEKLYSLDKATGQLFQIINQL
ncbi:MAG: hypothetical protein A3G92_07435 [Deltaproteobacteria bacterium RIFCSPLOWO2_12_FULL_38_8]|nr:MAG: hypothetical protein A3G92_07435 [Deltaproteobacteria bacterium RIFCSPLOWO2_12_FULL_38_8]